MIRTHQGYAINFFFNRFRIALNSLSLCLHLNQNMMFFRNFYYFGLALLLFSSCNLINPEEPVPAYIHLDKIILKDQTSHQAALANSYKITDAWVVIDGKSQGTYQMPCTFPVLKEGKHDIQITAGILDNGIGSTRSPYPFYTVYSKSVQFQKDSTLLITPEVSYTTRTIFTFNEDFESPGIIFDSTANSKCKIIKVNKNDDPSVFEGDYSGLVKLTTVQDSFEAVTVSDYKLPGHGSPVYLEINFKSDEELEVGFIAETYFGEIIPDPKLSLHPTAVWKKVYINFTEDVSTVLGSDSKATFKIILRSKLSEGKAMSRIYIDNIKLVHE